MKDADTVELCGSLKVSLSFSFKEIISKEIIGQLDDLAFFFVAFLECSGSRSWSCGCPGVMPVLNLDIFILSLSALKLCATRYYDLCTCEDERGMCV